MINKIRNVIVLILLVLCSLPKWVMQLLRMVILVPFVIIFRICRFILGVGMQPTPMWYDKIDMWFENLV